MLKGLKLPNITRSKEYFSLPNVSQHTPLLVDIMSFLVCMLWLKLYHNPESRINVANRIPVLVQYLYH